MPRSNIDLNQAERITALEVTVASQNVKLDAMSDKLDELLTLKNRGVGAFWLASTLVGTGIIGAVLGFIDWLKG